MINTAIQYSLIITFIFICYQDGMIFGWLRRFFERLNMPEWVNKPLFDCNICMSGLYTVLLWFVKDHHHLSFNLLWMICLVGGINVIISPFIEGAVMDYLMKLTKDK